MGSPKSHARWLRFSLASVLLLVLCAAGFFGGWRMGFGQGYAAGAEQRAAEQPHSKIYPVGALLRQAAAQTAQNSPAGSPRPELDFDSLMQAVQTTVHPHDWEALGGPNSMAPLRAFSSLAVYASPDVHAEIATFFDDLGRVTNAVAAARAETEKMMAARAAHLEQIFKAASEHIGQPITSIASDMTLDGTWNVERVMPESREPAYRFVFIDRDTVEVTQLQGANQTPSENFYFTAPPHIVISGQGYVAGTTAQGELVLIDAQDPKVVLIATEESEPK